MERQTGQNLWNAKLYEAPYGTKLIFFYRYDVVHVHTHFSNRSDRFLQSHRRTLLIELMVSTQISLF